MSQVGNTPAHRFYYSRSTTILLYLIFVSTVVRAVVNGYIPDLIFLYLGLSLGFIVLYTAMFFLPGLHPVMRLLYFGVQSGVTLYLISIHPEYDFSALLFLLLTYQAASWYGGKTRWILVMLLVALTPGSLMYFLGNLKGLSLGFLYVALEVVITGFTVAFQEMEAARAESQIVLAELKETHHQLELYASQVEELAAIDERNRLARELHDSVSQTLFSIALTTQAAQMLMKRDPGRAKEQLERLHELTQSALTSMRDLITQLRPKEESLPGS